MYKSLLKNNVYLFLLSFYNNKVMPNFVELAKFMGVTRQTVSTKIKKLLDDKIINIENNVVKVENQLDLDVELLKKILLKYPDISYIDLENIFCYNKDEKGILLTLEENEYINEERVVYGIISEGIIKYVGSTKEYSERIEQHIRKRPFLSSNNFIILKYVEGKDRFDYEKQLIKILQPEQNDLGK